MNPETIEIAPAQERIERPWAIVFGNEKGGTGKSTAALHVAVALLRQGRRVGTIDLDGRQGTLSHYLANRKIFVEASGMALPCPKHRLVPRSNLETRAQVEAEELAAFNAALADLADREFIIIDTPGSDSHLSRLGHRRADSLVTPVNDSYLDLDVLALIDPFRREVKAPSVYARAVWTENNRRVLAGQQPIDWIVMRNRLSSLDAHNKRDIESLLDGLARRLGFRVAPGFGERVAFRELFLKGLTLADLPGEGPGESPSRRAARSEVDALLETLGLAAGAAASAN
jgi:chromosome partitioning protein